MPIIALFCLIWCIRWVWKSHHRWHLPKFKNIDSAKLDRYLLRGALVAVILYVITRL